MRSSTFPLPMTTFDTFSFNFDNWFDMVKPPVKMSKRRSFHQNYVQFALDYNNSIRI